MKINWYYPSLPAVTSALIETRRQFASASQRGFHDIDIYKSWMLDFPTDEDREIAENYNVAKALEEAIQARVTAGLSIK